MARRALQPGDVLVVVHDFDARSNDELTLRRSERVELIELDDGFHDGWYLGKHLTRGSTGLFPGVYTQKAPNQSRNPTTPDSSTAHQSATVPHHVSKLSIGGASNAAQQSAPSLSVSDALVDLHPETTRSSLPAPHHTTYVQRSIGEALGEHGKGQDSPVMNETLNVIDEHMQDLSTPRQTLAPHRRGDDSESEYSSHIDRQSFLAGPETDDEDNLGLDEATVRSWDHVQTSQHLRDIGVDAKHCDIFEEQEITGDVLLDMDQNFIYMKEFDFGVMGRRLKTWHKIRDFQGYVKSRVPSTRASERSLKASLDQNSSRSGLASPQNQYSESITEAPGDMPQPLQPTQTSKRTSWAGMIPPAAGRATPGQESSARANTSTSRRSRRHSSIDFGAQPDLELSSLSTLSHQKQSSTDKSWSMAGSTQATTPTSSIKPSSKVEELLGIPSPTLPFERSPLDLDRGYFSGNDADNRKVRNRLSKSPRLGHSRQTSLAESTSKRTSLIKRHNRLSSVGSIDEDTTLNTSNASKAYTAQTKKGRFRSASARMSSHQSASAGASPTVTNLENESTASFGSPTVEKMRMQDRARKLMGFRTASDAVTSAEKTDAAKLTPSIDTVRSSDLVASPATGDTTPSATPSLDIDTPEGTDAASALTKNSNRPRPRTKQHTSAYTHGLLKIPPSEARKTCDHSGWMKKKSSGLMATWKPRLFILRGRRLSYYYSENDTEERGIIDISGHKVLAANDDPMVTIHASVTGASKASSTPRTETGASGTVKPSPPSGVFYFKLVPPKSGMSRAVQFTKPAIHYFQVDTINDGRKWMGEIMKATIEHDLSGFETTNRQKTISLAKARARRERPPALDDTKKVDEANEEKMKDKALRESGLGIEMNNTKTVRLADEDAAPTSPKPLSTVSNDPRTSLRKSTEEVGEQATVQEKEKEKELPAVPDEEEKENLVTAPPVMEVEGTTS